MSLRPLCSNIPSVWLAIALLSLIAVGDLQAAPRLSRSDFYRYHTWVKIHQDHAGDVEAVLSFPGLSMAVQRDTMAMSSDRLLTATRSLLVLEDFLVREWKRAEAFSPEQNITTARSYREVGEYAEALRWYRRAEANPGATADDADLRQEIFAVAVMTGDSLQVTRELLNLVGRKDLARYESTVETAVRWLVVSGDEQNLDHLMRKIEVQMSGLGPRLWFWYAYVQAVRDDRDGCLASLRRLMARTGAPEQLSGEQRGWVMRTYADLHYLAGFQDDALRLYILLAELDGVDGDWGRYQVANQHLLAGEYAQAGAIYSSFCTDSEHTSWAGRACEMATLVSQLDEIRKEGEPYGTDVVHSR